MMHESNKRILVVDDKVDIVETVSFCFAQEGYEIFTAFDGQEALDVARREQPDAIILDVMLPRENGYQVARFLREDWQSGTLPKRPKISSPHGAVDEPGFGLLVLRAGEHDRPGSRR